jgi:hypothetical protein
MVPAVGDTDLSSSERPAGLVIFPRADGLELEHRRAPSRGLIAAAIYEWRIFIVTLLVGACVVIAVALVLSSRSSTSAAPTLPPPAPTANPGSVPHP